MINVYILKKDEYQVKYMKRVLFSEAIFCGKQLDSTIQHEKYKLEFDRMLTNDIIHHLKMYKFNAHCAVLTFSYLYIPYLLIYSS